MEDVSSKLKKNANTFVANIVPDIYDSAANILKAIIVNKAGDDYDKGEKEIKAADELMLRKESEFVKLIESHLNGIFSKIDNLYDRYKESNGKFSKSMDIINQKNEKIVKDQISEKEKENEKQVQEWENERQKLLSDERMIFQEIERKVTESVTLISNEYKEKIKKVEDEIQQYQLVLQSAIHDKYSQPQTKAELIENEQRRMAHEHEEITKKYHQRKAEIEEETTQMKEKIEEIKEMIAKETNNSQSRVKRLEDAMMEERQLVIKEQGEKIKMLNERIESLEKDYSEKTADLHYTKNDFVVQLQQVENEYIQKISEENEKVKQEINEITDELKSDYYARYNEINDKITDVEMERSQSFEIMRLDHLKACELSDAEIYTKQKEYEREINVLKKKRDETKERLKAVRQQMENDLLEVKRTRQREFGEEMFQYDQVAIQQTEEINKIMKLFDDQQKKLTEIHQISVENRNRKKATQTRELKKEHQLRKQKILDDIDMQREKDIQEEINQKLEDLGDTNRGEKVNHLISKMTNKIDSLIETQERKMEDLNEYEEEEDTNENTIKTYRIEKKADTPLINMSFAMGSGRKSNYINQHSKSQATSQVNSAKTSSRVRTSRSGVKITIAKPMYGFTHKNSEEIFDQDVMQELEASKVEAERRKKLVVKETKTLDNGIKRVRAEFENRMTQLTQTYAKTADNLSKEVDSLESKKMNIQQNVNKQEEKLSMLREAAEQKSKEAEQFEQSLMQKYQEFTQQVKEEHEMHLAKAKHESETYQEKMEEIKEDFQAKIDTLQNKLKRAREATEKITNYMLRVREQQIESVEIELKTTSEERLKYLKEAHEKRIKQCDKELSDLKKMHALIIKTTKEEFEEKSKEEKEKFAQTRTEFEKEEKELRQQSETLDGEIEFLSSLECEDCKEKKKIIKNLLVKKDMLSISIRQLREGQLNLELKMNSIFTQEKNSYSSQINDFLVTSRSTPLPPKSQLKTHGTAYGRVAFSPMRTNPSILLPRAKTSLATRK